jgi:stage V sporulation protein K
VSADAKEHQGVIMPYLRKHHGGRWPDGEDIEAWMAVYQHWQDERGPADKNAPPEKSWSDMIAPVNDPPPSHVEDGPPSRRGAGGVDLDLSDQEKQWFGDALKKAQGEDALADLDKVIGLKPVKDQIRKTLNVVRLGQARDAAGLPRLDITHHLVFTGNPGTGKTMMARLTGRIYKQVGLLKSGHLISVERADLVGGYVGETAGKTRKVIDSAMDGILFIDEAYSLVPEDSKEDYGPEAIATLILAMENARDRLVVIVAGYRAEMKRFIDSNPGMASRFKTFIDFPDYSPEELGLMFQMRAASFGCHLSMDATVALAGLMAGAERGRGFGNGRMVRNVFEECVARQANRLAAAGGKVDVTVFEASDIPTLEELAAMKMP